MGESALKTLLDSLEISRSSLDHWLNFWTFLVVVGVVLEVAFVVWEYLEALGEFKRGEMHPPERPKRTKFVLELLGAAFVAIGVAGELYVEAKAGDVETQIRRANDSRVALLSKETGDAKTSAEGAASASARAQRSADEASLAAGNAQKVAGSVTRKADALDRQLDDTDKQLKAIEARRAELERSLTNLAVCNAPRVIPNWVAGGKTSADPMLPMATQKVFIEFVPDAEARRAAFNLAGTLSNAKWDVQIPLRIVDGLEDGVSVQPSMAGMEPSQNGAPEGLSAYWHASDVAEKLVNFLHSYNWQAKRGWPQSAPGKLLRDPNVLPPGTIRVQIGLYPAVVYVSPPGQRELTARLEEMRREEEKLTAELNRKRDEQLSTLPPEIRKQLQESEKEWDAQMKVSKNMAYPCQVLSPLL